MTMNASTRRSNIYRLLDDVIATGTPLTVVRKGTSLRIVPARTPGKLDRLPRCACIKGDPQSLVHLDWSKEWKHDAP